MTDSSPSKEKLTSAEIEALLTCFTRKIGLILLFLAVGIATYCDYHLLISPASGAEPSLVCSTDTCYVTKQCVQIEDAPWSNWGDKSGSTDDCAFMIEYEGDRHGNSAALHKPGDEAVIHVSSWYRVRSTTGRCISSPLHAVVQCPSGHQHDIRGDVDIYLPCGSRVIATAQRMNCGCACVTITPMLSSPSSFGSLSGL
jgi:hypothetical protein